MQFLIDLWPPILVSAVFVFVVSSVIHMALPIHKNDHGKLAGEESVLASMREQSVKPGSYRFPFANSMQEFSSPEMIERLHRGPVGFVTVYENGPMNIGRSLIQWFLFSLATSAATAYVTALTVPLGAEFLLVFRVSGTVAFLAYAFGVVPDSIWKGQKWSTTFKFLLDGLLYGLATGAAFGWLWPAA